MKRIFFIAIAAIFISVNSFSQSSNIQKTAKSVFLLTTFKADGSILATSHGVFVSDNGEAIAPWKPFEGADSAIVITTGICVLLMCTVLTALLPRPAADAARISI